MNKNTIMFVIFCFVVIGLWTVYVTVVLDKERDRQIQWIEENCVFIINEDGYREPLCPEQIK